MSDRHIAFTVVLDGAFKDEDAEPIRKAIEMIRGVISVVPVVREPGHEIAMIQVRSELASKLWKALEL